MLYALLSLFSTIIGASVGIGGGLIIRPVLAAMGAPKGLASFTSSITVLAMAIVTLIGYHRAGAELKIRRNLPVAAGSIAGGFLGGSLMTLVSTQAVNVAYIGALVLVVLVVTVRDKLPRIELQNAVLMAAVGMFTGVLSGFFGIGGGPFQVAALMIFFAQSSREAAVSSIMITLCTTASSLVRYTIAGHADFSLAIWMIPAAIVGGLLGSRLNRKLGEKQTTLIFNITVLAIAALQVWTVFIQRA